MAISVVGAEKFEKKVEVVVPKVEGKTVGELRASRSLACRFDIASSSLYQNALFQKALLKKKIKRGSER